jgi:hypothetical protein
VLSTQTLATKYYFTFSIRYYINIRKTKRRTEQTIYGNFAKCTDVELGKNRGDKVVLNYKIREERKQQEFHKIMHSCAALKSSSEKIMQRLY